MSHHDEHRAPPSPDAHAAVDNAPGVTEYWRSPDPRDEPEPAPAVPGALTLSRRGFLATLGAGASAVGLGGCVRRPLEKILPFAERPEDRIPGKPVFYATALEAGGSVLGLLVESFDGRPTKIEGNPKHPASLGAASAWAQAAVRDLYDGDRSTAPTRAGVAGSWDDFWAFADPLVEAARQRRGEGLALLLRDTPSPTLRRLVAEARAALPRARVFVHDEAQPRGADEALRTLEGPGARVHLRLDRAAVIVAVDADLLGVERDAVRHAHDFAAGRRLTGPDAAMNRLYAVEASLSLTGMSADHRLPLAASQAEPFLRALAHELVTVQGVALPPGAPTRLVAPTPPSLAPTATRFVRAVARDLVAHRGRSVVAVGARQPAAVHALAYLVNLALGNVGTSVVLTRDADAGPAPEPLAALAAALGGGQVETLVILGGNPVYEAPADLGFEQALGRARTTIHLGLRADETGQRCTWQLPATHGLEAWGDLRAADGTAAVVQPLIAPLFDGRSEIEVLARLLGQRDARGYDLVRATWRAVAPEPDFESRWSRWLADGVIAATAAPAATPAPRLGDLAGLLAAPRAPTTGALEADFRLDHSVCDGRYANNAWLQELPDPVTKLVWDNAALLGPATAAALGVTTGDVVALQARGRRLEIPAFVQPGQAEGTVGLPVGYGRSAAGRHGNRRGVNANLLRVSASPWFDGGVTATKAGTRQRLATTQRHGDMEGRPIIRSATREEYRRDPAFATRPDPAGPAPKSLWRDPSPRTGQQWGMAIDLSVCTGCSACVVACQAENNVPVVGKDQVLRHREMHWLRIDRYYKGAPDAPEVAIQPVPCMQCENAPCEQVCPVAATNHTPHGLNDQVYNRCIGTRYCSNNCPYKVRHFNFYDYNEGLSILDQMYQNPDVTVRGRGVMEKCTYCVQRINEATIAAKRDGKADGKVPDGGIVPACQQTCPVGAIVFGDVNDPASRVSRLKRDERSYSLLGELNTKPRTTYLAKVRNPNPELA
jgi:molybdopterin-containing oxidoreductase family iron-sulfur binding subunit